jgi:hypothetical protein
VEKHNSTASPASSIESEETIEQPAAVDTSPQKPVEVGGQKGPEPTRYGDWEKAGRCTDF